jgi:transcription elongation factor Elf1
MRSKNTVKDAIAITDFTYYCYRCGGKNSLDVEIPKAPDYHHQEIACSSCGDSTRVILAGCPDCEKYVYWINDLNIPSLVNGFAKYMVHNMQAMIDRAAQQGARISIDTPEQYPINATCPCGARFAVELEMPDLD